MECIILAGGLGTRLRSAIGDHPKCMAPVSGQPFLYYIFRYLQQQGCTRVILSLGYKAEVVMEWLAGSDWPFIIDHVSEHEPLGTGGGIQLAMRQATENDVAVLNGDTMFQVALAQQFAFHKTNKGAATLALKEMTNFDRYGIVNTGADGRITSFEERMPRGSGLINGGVYIMNKAAFLAKNLPEKFSFEKEYLEAFAGDKQFWGLTSNSYFIDIGIPEDYNKAQEDFKAL